MEEKKVNVLLLVLLVLYVLSPVDFFPGPVDDLLAILACCCTR